MSLGFAGLSEPAQMGFSVNGRNFPCSGIDLSLSSQFKTLCMLNVVLSSKKPEKTR
jgi:hypothetical protein